MKDGLGATLNRGDDAELERWERLYRVTYGAIIRAQEKTPNPKSIARLAMKLADAGYECVIDHQKKNKK
jgi:hypothetical protein